MKKTMTMITAFTLAACVFAADAVETKRPARMRRRGAGTGGGLLVKPGSCQGAVRFVNVNGAAPAGVVSETVNGIRSFMQIDLDTAETGEFSLASVDALRTKLGANEAVFIVNDPTLPMTLVAPEAGWGVINAASIKTDSPDEKTFSLRLQRLMWRQFAMINGAANTQFPHCVLKTVSNLKELDALSVNVVCPEPYGKIMGDLQQRGITPRQMTTYRQACKEGWAPSPTNDVQKGIWEQVKADKERGPTKPIMIEPPVKK